MKKFWQKHKVEILIGITAVAVVTAVAVGIACAAGTAAAATAGSAVPTKRNDDKKDKAKPAAPPPPPDPKAPKPDCTNIDTANATILTPQPSVSLLPIKIEMRLDTLTINGQQVGYEDALKPHGVAEILRSQGYPFYSSSRFPSSAPKQNCQLFTQPISHNSLTSTPQTFQIGPKFDAIPIYSSQNCPTETGVLAWMSKMIDWGNSDTGIDATPPIPKWENTRSQVFRTEGTMTKGIRFFGINGIDTSLEGSIRHAEYLAKLTQGHSVIWIHNHSNWGPVDAAEAAFINMNGSSPNVKHLLLEQWTAFHKENLDNPNAKCIQCSHSQGAIHTLNALMSAPKEIRDRVISITIAPAAIIPPDLCHVAFNYASEKDLVFYAEILCKSVTDLESAREALDKLDGLQLVEPHADALRLDHDFESITFLDDLVRHIKKYLDLQ